MKDGRKQTGGGGLGAGKSWRGDSMCETLREQVPGVTTGSEAVGWEERSKVRKVGWGMVGKGWVQ